VIHHRLTPSPCPKCGRVEDAATDPTGLARPKPNDLAICLYCLAVNIYGAGLELRAPTPAELVELRARPEWRTVQEYIRAAIRAAGRRGGQPW
jgi:hypothetical protein